MNRRLIREKTVCFTGHRSEKLPKGDVLKYLRIKLSEEIEKAIQDGYNTFLFGGTYGWELMAAEEVIKKRTVIDFNNPRYIRLIAVIPFGEQAVGYSLLDHELYYEIMPVNVNSKMYNF
ncbi:SLOG family protein [Xylanivirga thermophila]|uniref:SLOG family protein n=1 Tax=Xylanivirga thermophila TaxID=2496273 RepID=UPI0039F63183